MFNQMRVEIQLFYTSCVTDDLLAIAGWLGSRSFNEGWLRALGTETDRLVSSVFRSLHHRGRDVRTHTCTHKHLVKWCHAIRTRLTTQFAYQLACYSVSGRQFRFTVAFHPTTPPPVAAMMFLFISQQVNPSFSILVDASPLLNHFLMACFLRRWAVGCVGVHIWNIALHTFWGFHLELRQINIILNPQ